MTTLLQQSTRILGICLLLVMAGCATERDRVYVKDGTAYGVTSGLTWRGRWWNYYERGLSYAAGEFWQEAISDLQAALAQRQADQRDARTYGLHFLDYFPHRELGVVYYRLGRYTDAIHELETSLANVDTAKAKFYLNKARREALKQSGRDTVAPRIVLDSPVEGLWTNRLTLAVTGRAEDDAYVTTVAINGQALFIELAEPRHAFAQEVSLTDGPNVIEVTAGNLLGRLAHARRTIYVDRRGPLVSLDSVEVLGEPGPRRVRVAGLITDDSPIRRFLLADRVLPVRPESAWEFRQEVPLAADMTFLPFEVEDAAGNVTRGKIALSSAPGAPPGTREGKSILFRKEAFAKTALALLSPSPSTGEGWGGGALGLRCLSCPPIPAFPRQGGRRKVPSNAGEKPALPLLPRWASLHLGTVMSDLAASPPTPQWLMAQSEPDAPVIRLEGLAAEQTIYDDKMYLEGEVTAVSPIVAFAINGESQLQKLPQRRDSRRIFFGVMLPLQVEENRFRLEATDALGRTTQREVVVQRQVQEVRQLVARWRIAVLPLGQSGETAGLSDTAYDYLLAAFVQQARFRLMERARLEDILREHRLSQTPHVDRATAVRTGKVAAVEGILFGTVSRQTPQTLEVIIHFVDVETTEHLASADVYGEELELRDVKFLMHGLAWKFQQRFPLIEGVVVEREGERVLVNRGRQHALKQFMKAILFRDGRVITDPETGKPLGQQVENLGEVRITEVSDAFAQAVLLQSASTHEVKKLDKFITK